MLLSQVTDKNSDFCGFMEVTGHGLNGLRSLGRLDGHRERPLGRDANLVVEADSTALQKDLTNPLLLSILSKRVVLVMGGSCGSSNPEHHQL